MFLSGRMNYASYRRTLKGISLLTLFLLLFIILPTTTCAEYAYTELSMPPGWNFASPRGINDSGAIIGYAWNDTNNAGFLYQGGSYTTILPPGWQNTYATGINDKGAVILTGLDSGGKQSGSLYQGGSYTTLFPPGWQQVAASGINNNGAVTLSGLDNSGKQSGSLYQGGSYMTLSPPGWQYVAATGINDKGAVILTGLDSGGKQSGSLYQGGSYTTLSPPGWQTVYATGINDKGAVTLMGLDNSGKWSISLYQGGSYTTLSPPEWQTVYAATGINNNGAVTLIGLDNSGKQSISLYQGGSYTTILPPGWQTAYAGGINDKGVIVGSAYDGQGQLKMFIATPGLTPPPQAPQIYGLFIGTHGENNHRGDAMAILLGDRFARNIAHSFTNVKILTGDSINGTGITSAQVQNAISSFNVKSGDQLFIYISGHGGSFGACARAAGFGQTYFDEANGTYQNAGDEFIIIGKDAHCSRNQNDWNGYLSDDQLYRYLKDINTVNKVVILDSCGSAGFYTSNSITDEGDLSKLKKIAFLSSTATEDSPLYEFYLHIGAYDRNGSGLPIFGLLLLDAIAKDSNGKIAADRFNDGLDFDDLDQWFKDKYKRERLKGLVGSVLYPNSAEFPLKYFNPLVFSYDIWNPFTIKSDDYVDVQVTESATIVTIDIKPERYPNIINLKSNGEVPIAILTTADFDARLVDPSTVEFAGTSPIRWKMRDINNDGYIDMLLFFRTQDLDLNKNSREAILTGKTTDGKEIEGKDTVNIVFKGMRKIWTEPWTGVCVF